MTTQTPSLDLARVRAEFPALAGEWTFLDNAGGSQTLARVADRVRDYLLTSDVQHGATYAVSALAEQRVAEGQAALARLVNAADPGEVVVGGSSSALLRVLALCLGRTWQPGDEVVVTNCDHESNIGPWRDLEEHGVRVRTWNVNRDTWRLEIEDLVPLLNDRTRLVSCTHVSNVLGSVHPVGEWARLVHDAGARICVDGVAYAPHDRVDVQAWDVDFYVLSLYKVYGPHLAVMYGKRAHLEALPRWNHFFIEDPLPYRLQPGNVNYELTWAAGGIVEYLEELGDGDLGAAFARMRAHEHGLTARLLDWLGGRAGVRLIGPADAGESRVPTVSFVVEGRRSSELPPHGDAAHVGFRWGDFYARRLVDDLGLAEQDGVVRVSAVHYNTADEIDAVLRVLDAAI